MDSFLKISDIGITDLQDWIAKKIREIADDFGQKLDDDQKIYIPKRVYQFLLEKFRNWQVGTIESIFKAGVCGKYGKVSKITVSILLYWLTTEDRNSRGENVQKFEDVKYSTDDKDYFVRTGDKCIPFLEYCHNRMIDISELNYQQYCALRDRFNFDPTSTEIELENFPRYKNIEFAKKIIFS